MENTSLLIHPDELSYRWIDRMADNKITTLALHPAGGKNAHISLADMLEKLEDPEYRKMLDHAADRGLSIEYEMHAARYLLPSEQFEKHPEWFRINKNGERVTDYNFCASNEQAVDYICERAAELVKKLYRSTDRYFLWLDDSKDAFCHCERCKSLSPSDTQLKILNRILKRLKQDNRKARLAYLAYFECITPPKVIMPERDIFLEYAPFERDHHAPVGENGQSEHLCDLISFFGRENAKVLDYWYDNSLFSKWKKPPVPFSVDKAVLKADIEYYKSLGFEDIGCFACFLGDDYEALHGDVDITPFAIYLCPQSRHSISKNF